MRKLGAAAIAVALAVALAVGLTAAPAQAQSTSKDRTYLYMVKTYSSLANLGTDRQLIKMGKTVCKVFDGGATLLQLVAGVLPTLKTTDAEDLFSATTAAAVTIYCPRHSKKLR